MKSFNMSMGVTSSPVENDISTALVVSHSKSALSSGRSASDSFPKTPGKYSDETYTEKNQRNYQIYTDTGHDVGPG